MTWKSGLRPAKFRGVAFHASDRGLKGGRAAIVHEFPKRNSPYTEDMGRKGRRWNVDGYIVGDDYMARRDALVAACEKPGPGSYEDHWGRSGVVLVEDYDIKESSGEGRIVRVSLQLVEAGGAAAGLAGVATTAVLAGAAQALGGVAVAGFAGTGLVGQMPAAVGAAVARFGVQANSVAGLVAALTAGQGGAVGDTLRSAHGVSLSRGVPARVPGSVLQAPALPTIDRALPR